YVRYRPPEPKKTNPPKRVLGKSKRQTGSYATLALRLRFNLKPSNARPASSMTYVSGSGTAETERTRALPVLLRSSVYPVIVGRITLLKLPKMLLLEMSWKLSPSCGVKPEA